MSAATAPPTSRPEQRPRPPFVLLLRLFGKRFLDNRWKDGRESYWRDHQAADATLDRYRRQF